MITISAQSLEYVKYVVKPNVNGNPSYNPTSDVVVFAFTTTPVLPATPTWYAGSWETDTTAGTQYLARCLVGPGGTVTLAVGKYTVWIKVTDSPEIPVKQPGQLKVY